MNSNDSLPPGSDEELLSRLQGGEREAFGLLVHRYERELYGYLRRYTGDADLAEDVFQLTFLQVFQKISQYEVGRPAKPWIYTIATHQAIDAMRRAGRRTMVSLEQSTGEGDNGEVRNLLDMLETRENGPLDQMQESEKRSIVRACLDRLPEMMREVILLTYYQGLKYREAAEVLGVPVGTVKSRLHAALRKLQESWSETPSLPEI